MSKQATTNLAKELKKQEKKEKHKPSEEEVEERQKTIWKIKKYLASPRFGEYITKDLGIKYSQAQLQRMSLSTLKNLLARIRVSVNMKNTDSMFERMTKGGAVMLESSASMAGYDLDGYADELFQNEDFLNALECTKIEADLPTIPAPAQLLLIATQTALIVYKKNQIIKQHQVKKKTKQKEPQEIKLEPPQTQMKPPTIGLGEII